jgi:hypothetical protein
MAAVLSRDTTSDAERVQIELWRSMPPSRKAELTGAMFRSLHELTLAGLRGRHPDADEAELRMRWAWLTLGAELASRAFPEASAIIRS